MSKKAKKKSSNKDIKNAELQPISTSEKPIIVKLEEHQIEEIIDNLTERIEWSTNRIVDEVSTKKVSL